MLTPELRPTPNAGRSESRAKIVVTGAAGLVGQNLLLLLADHGYTNLVAIDKLKDNLRLARDLNPKLRTAHADLALNGSWEDELAEAGVVVILHAQITSKHQSAFIRNNVDATRLVLEASKRHGVPYAVLISSSVIHSSADDNYTRTKAAQENIFLESGIPGCVLRPTLMYGWFDPKHLGWLARFMEKTPVFPIPGHGRYIRQPLYNRDFCRAILWCLEHRPIRKIYDLVGSEHIHYIEMIREIRRVKGLRTPIVRLPYWLFYTLLRAYALFSDHPPFTADQLKALTAGDEFIGVNIKETFGFEPTPFSAGIEETFCHPLYSKHVIKRV